MKHLLFILGLIFYIPLKALAFIMKNLYIIFLTICMAVCFSVGVGLLPAPSIQPLYLAIAFGILGICELKDINTRFEALTYLYTFHFKSLNLDIDALTKAIEQDVIDINNE